MRSSSGFEYLSLSSLNSKAHLHPKATLKAKTRAPYRAPFLLKPQGEAILNPYYTLDSNYTLSPPPETLNPKLPKTLNPTH